jgi:hypothetical protein
MIRWKAYVPTEDIVPGHSVRTAEPGDAMEPAKCQMRNKDLN